MSRLLRRLMKKLDRSLQFFRCRHSLISDLECLGDLRVFGPEPQPIRVRVPSEPRLSVALGEACEAAFATSGIYFGGELRDPRGRRRLRPQSSITVRAASCMAADALTKAVAVGGPQPALLARFAARAFLVDECGAVYAARG